MNRSLFLFGSASGFVAVAAGAFGAHALKERLDANLLEAFQTGAHYQLAVSILIVALALAGEPLGSQGRRAGVLFATGIVVFSGSLYALALTGVRMWGAVTPVGGLCFLAGWMVLFASALRLPGKS